MSENIQMIELEENDGVVDIIVQLTKEVFDHPGQPLANIYFFDDEPYREYVRKYDERT